MAVRKLRLLPMMLLLATVTAGWVTVARWSPWEWVGSPDYEITGDRVSLASSGELWISIHDENVSLIDVFTGAVPLSVEAPVRHVVSQQFEVDVVDAGRLLVMFVVPSIQVVEERQARLEVHDVGSGENLLSRSWPESKVRLLHRLGDRSGAHVDLLLQVEGAWRIQRLDLRSGDILRDLAAPSSMTWAVSPDLELCLHTGRAPHSRRPADPYRVTSLEDGTELGAIEGSYVSEVWFAPDSRLMHVTRSGEKRVAYRIADIAPRLRKIADVPQGRLLPTGLDGRPVIASFIDFGASLECTFQEVESGAILEQSRVGWSFGGAALITPDARLLAKNEYPVDTYRRLRPIGQTRPRIELAATLVLAALWLIASLAPPSKQ